MTDYDAYNSTELAEIYDAVYADRDDHAFWAAVAPDDGQTQARHDGPVVSIEGRASGPA